MMGHWVVKLNFMREWLICHGPMISFFLNLASASLLDISSIGSKIHVGKIQTLVPYKTWIFYLASLFLYTKPNQTDHPHIMSQSWWAASWTCWSSSSWSSGGRSSGPRTCSSSPSPSPTSCSRSPSTPCSSPPASGLTHSLYSPPQVGKMYRVSKKRTYEGKMV